MEDSSLRSNGASPPPPGLGTVVHLLEQPQPQQPYDEDDHSGEIREYNGVFEGPEKTLGKILSLFVDIVAPCI